jgi:hypothetical protein
MGEHRLAGGSVTVHAEFGDGSEDGCVGVHASSVPRSTTSLVPIFVPAELICRGVFSRGRAPTIGRPGSRSSAGQSKGVRGEGGH